MSHSFQGVTLTILLDATLERIFSFFPLLSPIPRELIQHRDFTTDSGQVTVLLWGGRPLVEDVQSFNLATRVDPDDPQRLLVDLNDPNGNGTDVTAQIRSGHIHGLLVGLNSSHT